MKLKPSFIHNNKGLESVTAVFMLLLMFAIMIGVIFTFQTYNSSLGQQAATNVDRSKESLTLIKQVDPATNFITSINITNTGTTEATIRAIYITPSDGRTTFLDPSTSMNTAISPNHFLTISSSILSSHSLSADTSIIASTENGVKAVESLPPTPTPSPAPTPDPDTLTYGSLMLRFSGFMYRNLNDPNVPSSWHPGWSAPQKINCEWRVTITNVGKRDLTLTQTSSFTVKGDTNSAISKWNLASNVNLLVGPANAKNVVFSNVNDKTFSSGTTCTTFLTFYGSFIDDGTPYAQTIPFEAFTIP